MKFLSDHCVSMRTVTFLRSNGFSITTLKELGKQKVPDPQVIKLAQSRKEILITEDTDFGNILNYPPEQYHGIIVLSTKSRKRVSLHKTLFDFFQKKSPGDLIGKLIIIEDAVVRIRT